MMRKYGARLLDIGSIEDGGDRGWAVSKAPPGHVSGRVPFISTRELHAMCYGPPQLRKSPAAIAMQARQTRVNAIARPSGHRPLSRVSTASASAPLLLEDTKLQRMGSRHSQTSHMQLQDWSRPQTAFAIQDWNANAGQLAALQDQSRPYTAQDLVAVVERRLGDDAGRSQGDLDMVEARSLRSNSRPSSSRSRNYHSPGPPSRSSSKGSRRSSKGPSRSSSKGPNSRPISALALSNGTRPSTPGLALTDKGRRSSKSSRRFSRASKSSHAGSFGSHTDDEDLLPKSLKDRKLSSGACLGLDLVAFEQRKSNVLQKTDLPQTPQTPKDRPSTASRRPSETSSRMSRRATDVGTPRSKADESPKKADAPGPKAAGEKEQTKGIFRMHMEERAKEAFQKRNKGTSVVLGGEDEDPVQRPGHHLLPATIRALDLPTAIDFFEHHDKVRAHGSTGLLDRKAFLEMLCAIAQGKERMTEEWSNAIFEAVDFERRGLLDKDQVLGWEFGLHNNYHSNIRRRFHKVVNDAQVTELLDALAIGSGFRSLSQLQVTKEDLWFLVDTCRVPLSQKASDELHAYLSVGHDDAGLNPHELLNWLFPGRELRTLQTKVEQMRQQHHLEDEDLDEEQPEPIQKSNYKAPKRPLWENRLKQPIVLEFTVAHGCLSKINFIKENLEPFNELQLEVVVAIDDTLRDSFSKVVAKIGREIVLWDAGSMMPYREDPFETKASSWAWLKNYLMTSCPDAIEASQVAFFKTQKRQLKQLSKRSGSKARRQSRLSRQSAVEPEEP